MKITLYQIDFKLRVKNDSKIIFYFYRFGSFAKTNSIKKNKFVRVETINFVKIVHS